MRKIIQLMPVQAGYYVHLYQGKDELFGIPVIGLALVETHSPDEAHPDYAILPIDEDDEFLTAEEGGNSQGVISIRRYEDLVSQGKATKFLK